MNWYKNTEGEWISLQTWLAGTGTSTPRFKITKEGPSYRAYLYYGDIIEVITRGCNATWYGGTVQQMKVACKNRLKIMEYSIHRQLEK